MRRLHLANHFCRLGDTDRIHNVNYATQIRLNCVIATVHQIVNCKLCNTDQTVLLQHQLKFCILCNTGSNEPCHYSLYKFYYIKIRFRYLLNTYTFEVKVLSRPHR